MKPKMRTKMKMKSKTKTSEKIPGYEVRHQILKYGLDMEVFESIKEKKSSEPFNHEIVGRKIR